LKQLVAYITSCYPEKSFSVDLALALGQSGVDSVELGVPFSDPVADGPVIEKANHIALENGFRFQDVLDISKEIGDKVDTLWMGYFNPFYQYGIDDLLQEAKALHVSGLIIPDLPYEETLTYKNAFDANGVANISFVAPTDSKERIAEIVKDAKKFIYMVAYTGITGSGKAEDLQPFIASIKEVTDTPAFVGFGVNEKTAKDKVRGADGVIVGSAFIDILLRENLSYSQKIEACSKLASIIKNEINA
jgi:tryptophan synthase alpha chain